MKVSTLQGAIVLSDKASELIPSETRASFALDPATKYHWRSFTTPEVSQKLQSVWTKVKLT